MKEEILKGIYRVLKIILISLIIVIILFNLYRSVEKSIFYPLKYREEVFNSSDKYSLSRATVYALIKTESSFNSRAKSNKGAKGLMQITDKTGEFIAKKLCQEEYDLFNVEDSIEFGCYYIRYLIDKFGNERTALIAYNAGEGNVSNWLKDNRYSEDGEYLKEIPFDETKDYIDKIYKRKEKYKKLYGKLLDKQINFE